MEEVHVLLVDSDVVSRHQTCKLLEFNSYKVTAVGMADIASSMLAKQKVKYDVVMVDVNSSDLQAFQLVHDAIDMDLTVILMSENPNATLVKCAIEDGAFLFVEKPASMDILKYLWQHVLRENTRKSKEHMKFKEIISSIRNPKYISNSEETMMHTKNTGDNIDVSSQKGLERFNFGSENDYADKGKIRPKICTEWTQELHNKFVDAVKELGEGRCFPSDILGLMNVPGLKRMQVASHLQKCRQGWRPPQERKPNYSKSPKYSKSKDLHGNPKPKKYGSYPRIAKGSLPQFLLKNEHVPPTNAVEDSICTLDRPENMKQNTEISDNVSNNIGDMNEISGDNFNLDDPFDFVVDSSDGMKQNIDFNYEGSDIDHIFSQISGDSDKEPRGFWSSFISNFSTEQGIFGQDQRYEHGHGAI